MSFLTSILNPEPAGEESRQSQSQSPNAVRKNSQPQMPPNYHDESQRQRGYPDLHGPEYEVAPTGMARDAAQALAALSSSNAPPPVNWSGYHHAPSDHSPTDVHAEIRRLSAVRRPSSYGENAGPIELPQPPDVARKMSSPTLDQYHVASRSPEHVRRSSFIVSSDQGLTLPPIQSFGTLASTQQQQQPAEHTTLEQQTQEESARVFGQDNSVIFQSEEGEERNEKGDENENGKKEIEKQREEKGGKEGGEEGSEGHRDEPSSVRAHNQAQAGSATLAPDVVVEAVPLLEQHEVVAETSQQTTDARGTEFTHTKLTTAQSRSSPDSSEPQPSSQPPRNSLPALDTTQLDTNSRTSFSAHSPLSNLKQDHTTHANSPLRREASIPIPTTEMPNPAAPAAPRKRPPPKSAVKKGTASSVKKDPPSKKKKSDPAAKPSGTPSASKPKGALANAKRLASNSSANSSPAPRSVRNASTPAVSVASPDSEAEGTQSEAEEDQGTPDPDAELYCLCQKPDTGSFMIACDGGCDDWYHGKCVGIAERDNKLIDRYICPPCAEKGKGTTTWKRMCRRAPCRQPARVAGTTIPGKNGKGDTKETMTSKYCSQACGDQFIKDILATRTRKAAEASLPNPKAKKPDTTTSALKANNEDLGPMGGALSIGELKALVDAASNVKEFKRLGEPILPPSDIPSSSQGQANPSNPTKEQESRLSQAEQERFDSITAQKDATRFRHMLLKDRLKFNQMLREKAIALTEERGLKPKEFCGYDSRQTWTDDEFIAWRNTPAGAESLRTGKFVTNTDGDTDMADAGPQSHPEVCDKKKCARHNDWGKLALDDTRYEMSENSEVMRGLDRSEKELLQRAALRARVAKSGGAGGEVIFAPQSDSEDDESADEARVEVAGQAKADGVLADAAVPMEGVVTHTAPVAEDYTTDELAMESPAPPKELDITAASTVDELIATSMVNSST